MIPVSPAAVGDALVARSLMAEYPQSYASAFSKAERLDLKLKMQTVGLTDALWRELFLGTVEWYATELDAASQFVNRTQEQLLGSAHSCGMPVDELLAEYKHARLPAADVARIDALRAALPADPRIVVLTTDQEEYVILSGWHSALAYVLEGKPLPVYVGIADSFSCFVC